MGNASSTLGNKYYKVMVIEPNKAQIQHKYENESWEIGFGEQVGFS
jgi:hypothetical protein